MNAVDLYLRNSSENNVYSSSSEEDELTINDIIEYKPKTKIVREFFRDNLIGIKSDEDKLFNNK